MIISRDTQKNKDNYLLNSTCKNIDQNVSTIGEKPLVFYMPKRIMKVRLSSYKNAALNGAVDMNIS